MPHLSCSARSYLDTYKQRMFCPVSVVADMEASRYVDPVFQHSRRRHVGFIRGLWNTLVSCLLPRKLGLRDSIWMPVQATDMF